MCVQSSTLRKYSFIDTYFLMEIYFKLLMLFCHLFTMLSEQKSNMQVLLFT